MEAKQIQSYRPPEDDSEKKTLLAIIFFLLAMVIGALAFFEHQPIKIVDGSKTESKMPPPEEVNRIVNRHLKQTFHKIEGEKIRIQLENLNSMPKIGQSILPSASSGVDMMPDRNEESVAQHLDRSRSKERRFQLDQQIQGELQDQENQEQAKAEYQAEYARQFVENARKKGWAVQLDENYVVISVRPIKKPDANMQLFVPEGEGAR